MSRTNEQVTLARKLAHAHVAEIRARTVCESCGGQPIEWHHDEHSSKPYFRVNKLASLGMSVARVQKEIDRCRALCRRCHMAEDGRLSHLGYDIHPPPTPPRPCIDCGVITKPTRRGRCQRCYDLMRGYPRQGRSYE